MNKISSFLLQIVLGVIIGLVIGGFMFEILPVDVFINFGIDTFIYFMIMIVVSFILQLILHEAGHLLFGKLANFKFISFRIGSYVLTKEDKFKISRLKLAGTGGQCLMEPAEPNYSKYLWYLLGGGLCNLVVACLFLFIGIINQDLLIDIFSFSSTH